MVVDGVALVDQNGVIRYANERLAAMSGYEVDDLIGKSAEALMPGRRRRAQVNHRREFGRHQSARGLGATADLKLLCRDGSEMPVDVVLSPVQIGSEEWIAASIRDDSERRSANHMQDQEDLRFRLAFEDNMAPMVFTDLDDHVTAVNDAFCDLIGFSRDEILGGDSSKFTYPDDHGISEESVRSITKDGDGKTCYVKRYIHKDGRVIVVEVSRTPARDGTGKVLFFVISEVDISERVQRNLLLRLLGRVSRLASYATNESELLQQMCEAMVDEGGYSLAWVGITSQSQEGGVDVMCASGATDFLNGAMPEWWGSNDTNSGPLGISLRTGTTQVANDLTQHEDFREWGERAARFGLGSMIAIPDTSGERRAVLVSFHRDRFAFDDITVRGLEEIMREAERAIVHVRSTQAMAKSLEETIVANESLRKSERALSESEQRFRLSFESNMAPMIFSDHDDLAIAVNDAFCDMVGFTREEILGHDSTQFTFPEDVGITEGMHSRLVADEFTHARYVKRYQRKDGQVVVSEVSRSAALDETGLALYFFSSERDVTDERALSAQLVHIALHDPLTGLANRALFQDRLTQAQARTVREGGRGAVILLNLDDFKGVNDTYSHGIGDELLTAVARRLESVTRSSDTLCHFGGDEFLYLAEGLKSADEAQEIAKRLLEALAQPFSIAGMKLEQQASMGIALWDTTSTDFSELVQNADAALREAKSLHRGNFTLFSGRMHELAVNRFTLVQELRVALHAGELAMHYQPIVNLTTSQVVGFEALMRWRHPERGLVPPDVFIPLAEKSHLIIELGAFALREAVAAASAWGTIEPQGSAPYVTVNLSAHQFHHRDLVSMIRETLIASGLSPHRLILEITESAALLNVVETLEVIEQLHLIGVGIALDDFGTGFSSLSYLTMLQPRIIKIDKSFVSPLHGSPQNDTLLEAIVSLGNKLEMTMLAEGIETSAQLERLRSLSCELGQGFLFSAAVPIGETTALVHHTFVSSSAKRELAD